MHRKPNQTAMIARPFALFVRVFFYVLPCSVGFSGDSAPAKMVQAPEGWKTASPHEEVRPDFAYQADGGRSGKGVFVIQHDGREGLDGYWMKTFPVTGGQFYRF